MRDESLVSAWLVGLSDNGKVAIGAIAVRTRPARGQSVMAPVGASLDMGRGVGGGLSGKFRFGGFAHKRPMRYVVDESPQRT